MSDSLSLPLDLFRPVTSLPLASALDALEHVENLRFDVVLVSAEMRDLCEFLHHASKHWLEFILLGIPDISKGFTDLEFLPLPCDMRELVLGVSEACVRGSEMSYDISEAWYTAWYGEAGEDIYATIPTRAELQARIEELEKAQE